MEVGYILRLLRRWLWLIIAAAVVGAGITLVSSINRTFTYEAKTKVLIGGFMGSTNPNRGDIETGAGLAEIYVELVGTPTVLQGVIDALELDTTVADLKNMVVAGKPGDPPIIIIQAFYSDPETAVAIANETARQLVLHSPTNPTPAQQAQIDLAREQITILNTQVQETLAEIEQIDQRLGADPNGQTENSPLTQQRRALIDQVNQATANIAQFSATIASYEQSTNRPIILEEAVEGSFFRTGPGLAESIFLSALTGVVLAVVAILLIDYLDTTIKTSKNVATLLDVPVIGTIPQLGRKGEAYQKRLLTNWSPRSAIAESYRALQTNLLAASSNGHNDVFLLTSPGEHEGKSVTAANLALSMANSGLRTLLIDADLVQPRLHEIFGLENERGLKNLIGMTPAQVDASALEKPLQQLDIEAQQTINNLNAAVQRGPVDNLLIITSGPTGEGSTNVNEYQSLREWLSVFRLALKADVILFDTPPCLLVSDTSILASAIRADCVLVVQAGRTKRDAAVQARAQFVHIGRDIRGVVLNRVRPADIDHGYNSGYYQNQPVDMHEALTKPQFAAAAKPDPRVVMNGAASEPIRSGQARE